MKRRKGIYTVKIICAGIFLILTSGLCGCGKRCSMPDCREKRVSGSDYCYLHDLSNRTYGNPDYNEVYEESKERQEEYMDRISEEAEESSDGSSSAADESGGSSSNSEAGDGTGSSSGDGRSDSTQTYRRYTFDPYDADEYEDGDEFADEWAEDFGEGIFDEGYDDAYDYWEEQME